ncbi:MAG: hypothetical protein ERJ67_08750 [Aphanocapsa feldmannii 277cV]|uniref:Uncharacterized protein n=1 Tax=Aphanocapsa feldmannii 277cV TaxID=2507553 RepID=A0A524RL73_9CHRO|nr:MAG: hypothetical protein ERJ67_08750 [Aphanocapsa feldmannii 277cV]
MAADLLAVCLTKALVTSSTPEGMNVGLSRPGQRYFRRYAPGGASQGASPAPGTAADGEHLQGKTAAMDLARASAWMAGAGLAPCLRLH